MNLYGKTRKSFFKFIKDDFPNYYEDIRKVYGSNPFPNKEYKKELYSKIYKIRKKHNLSSNYINSIKEKTKEFKNKDKQVTLYDLTN